MSGNYYSSSSLKKTPSFEKFNKKSEALLSTPQKNNASLSRSSLGKLADSYIERTSNVIKFIDKYLLFQFIFGLLIIAFCIVTKRENYQAFVGTEMSCVGSFIFAGIKIYAFY